MTLPKRALTVNGDPVRIEQIILNLLNNAGKYTPVGGRIEIDAAARRRRGRSSRSRDNGVGIADDLRPRLFQLFQQGNRDLARGEGGLGHRPQRRAPAWSSCTTARSRRTAPGRARAASSWCACRWPRAPTLRLPQPPRPLGPRQAPRRVLVVDDNRDAAETLGMLLEPLGS